MLGCSMLSRPEMLCPEASSMPPAARSLVSWVVRLPIDSDDRYTPTPAAQEHTGAQRVHQSCVGRLHASNRLSTYANRNSTSRAGQCHLRQTEV